MAFFKVMLNRYRPAEPVYQSEAGRREQEGE